MFNRQRMCLWLKTRKIFLFKFIGISATTAMVYRLLSRESFVHARDNHNNKLISVLLLTRHGARTPLHLISGLEQAEYKPELMEPYVKANYKLKTLDGQDLQDILSFYDKRNYELKLKGGIGRGQLTSVGEKQMFDLGRIIKKKYVEDLKFLSPNYDPNEIYTRSTHYKRTINSAKSVLAGIYLDSPDDSPKDPFIINVENLTVEYLFPNVLSCTYYAEALQFFEKLKLFKNKEYVDNLLALNNALKFGANQEDTNYSYTAFRDDMLARKVHDLPVPSYLETFVEKSDRYANMELTAQHDFNPKLACGQLLNLLKQNLLKSIENDLKQINQQHHKFKLYSAHDSTLNALLVAFNLIDEEKHSWPPFAANLIIELWKNDEQNDRNGLDASNYSIKLIYCGNPISIPECDNKKENKCNIRDFIKIMERNAIEKHEFNRICSQKFIS